MIREAYSLISSVSPPQCGVILFRTGGVSLVGPLGCATARALSDGLVFRFTKAALQFFQNNLTQSVGITLAASGMLDDFLRDDLSEGVCAISKL
jgi:hypothetical protein